MSDKDVIDATDFIKGMGLYKNMVNEQSAKGMKNAVDQLYNDAVNVTPTVPHLEGNLRGDVTRKVELKLMSLLTGFVIFNMPYAHKQHEGLDFNFSEPGAGAKYLEAKLAKFGNRYFGMISRAIRSQS